MKLTEIKTNPNNPRFIRDDKFAKLVESLRTFPQMMELRPIIVDEAGVALGGNMRLRALQELGYKEIPNTWVKQVADLTEEQKAEFIIKDNVGFGEWDWEQLANEWNAEHLSEWGLDFPGMDFGVDEAGDDFSLADGDKPPFQQMTFTLSDEQAVDVQNALAEIRKTDEFKYAETFGNENGNGNALHLIITQWDAQRKL